MQLTTKYDILENVMIPAIKSPAIVTAIKYDGGPAIIYELAYWINGEYKFVWLYEKEILPYKKG
jgi:hypothetical protein